MEVAGCPPERVDSSEVVDSKIVDLLDMSHRYFRGQVACMAQNNGVMRPETVNALLKLQMLLAKADVKFTDESTLREILYPTDADPHHVDTQGEHDVLPVDPAPERIEPDKTSAGIEVSVVAFFIYPSLKSDLEFERFRVEVNNRTILHLQRQFDQVFPTTDDEFEKIANYQQIAPVVDDVLASNDFFKELRYMFLYIKDVNGYTRSIKGERDSECRRAIISLIASLKSKFERFTASNLGRWHDVLVDPSWCNDDENEEDDDAMVVESDVFGQ